MDIGEKSYMQPNIAKMDGAYACHSVQRTVYFNAFLRYSLI
jgi:hypothetical protein